MALAPVTLAVRLMMQAHLLAKYFSAQLEFPELEFLGIEFQMVAHMHWASPYSPQHD